MIEGSEMYDYFRGKVMKKEPTSVVMDCAGIGYRFRVPLSTFEKIREGEETTLLTHFHLRDDGATLYGFATLEERALFEKLLSVTGVGPALALLILSGSTANEFCQAVEAGDAEFLKRIKGVGEKTAQRVILELKGKLPALETLKACPLDRTYQARMEVCLALESLGFSSKEASSAVDQAMRQRGKDGSVEELLREALRYT